MCENHAGPCWGSTSSFHWIPFEGKFKGNSMGVEEPREWD